MTSIISLHGTNCRANLVHLLFFHHVPQPLDPISERTIEGVAPEDGVNKTLQNILWKIVNENRTDWDTKLHNSIGISYGVLNMYMDNPVLIGIQVGGCHASRVLDS